MIIKTINSEDGVMVTKNMKGVVAEYYCSRCEVFHKFTGANVEWYRGQPRCKRTGGANGVMIEGVKASAKAMVGLSVEDHILGNLNRRKDRLMVDLCMTVTTESPQTGTIAINKTQKEKRKMEQFERIVVALEGINESLKIVANYGCIVTETPAKVQEVKPEGQATAVEETPAPKKRKKAPAKEKPTEPAVLQENLPDGPFLAEMRDGIKAMAKKCGALKKPEELAKIKKIVAANNPLGESKVASLADDKVAEVHAACKAVITAMESVEEEL